MESKHIKNMIKKVTSDELRVTNGGNSDPKLFGTYHSSLITHHFASGSALLITLLIVSVISAAAFGVGKLTLQNVGLTGSLEDSTVAYQVARAGIEEGLLRWRYDHAFETGDPAGSTEALTQTFRTILPAYDSLDLPGETVVENYSTVLADSLKKTYDLRSWFHADKIGTGCNPALSGIDQYQGDNGTAPTLAKDETRELDVSNLTGITTVIICWSNALNDNHHNYQNGYAPTDDLNSFSIFPSVEVIPIDGSGNVLTGPNLKTFTLPNERGALINVGAGGVARLRFKPFIYYDPTPGSPFSGDETTTHAELDSALNPRIVFSVVPSVGVIDSGVHYIESTGYFGTAKRRLRAELDRTSGRLLGLFDFSIYSGTDLSQ